MSPIPNLIRNREDETVCRSCGLGLRFPFYFLTIFGNMITLQFFIYRSHKMHKSNLLRFDTSGAIQQYLKVTKSFSDKYIGSNLVFKN